MNKHQRIEDANIRYQKEYRHMKLGVRVKMVDCQEALYHQDDVWTIRSLNPAWMCGDWVVWLDGYTGAFCCEFLKIVPGK